MSSPFPINCQLFSKEWMSTMETLRADTNGFTCVTPELVAAVKDFRKKTCASNPQTSQLVEDEKVVPLLVECLNAQSDHNKPLLEELLFEIAWTLTNVCAGSKSDTLQVIEAGALGKMVELVRLYANKNQQIASQCMWAFGNIVADGPELRSLVEQTGIMEDLTQITMELTMKRDYAFLLCSYCKVKPYPVFDEARSLMERIMILMQSCDDRQVRTDCAWALSYLSSSDPNITEFIRQGCVSAMIQAFHHSLTYEKEVPAKDSLMVPALRCLGNIVTGNDHETQNVLDAGLLQVLVEILSHETLKCMWKESLWTLSNVTAGNRNQIQAVLDTGIMERVIELSMIIDPAERGECMWVIANLTSGGSKKQIMKLLDYPVVKAFISYLKSLLDDSVSFVRAHTVALEGLTNIAQTLNSEEEDTFELVVFEEDSCERKAKGKGKNSRLLDLLDECEGVETLQELVNIKNHRVADEASRFVQTFNIRYSFTDLVPLKIFVLRKLWKENVVEDGSLIKATGNHALRTLYEIDEHLMEMVQHSRENSSTTKSTPFLLDH